MTKPRSDKKTGPSSFPVRKLAFTAVLTAMALVVFVLEAQLPSLTPVPGIKLGLANIFTLFALEVLGAPWAAALLVIRVILGSAFSGQMSVLLYSGAGGLLAYTVMALASRLLPKKLLPVVSVLGALCHNLGQILVAVLLTGTPALFAYLPVLVISGILTGTFTGFAALFTLKGLEKSRLLKQLSEAG